MDRFIAQIFQFRLAGFEIDLTIDANNIARDQTKKQVRVIDVIQKQLVDVGVIELNPGTRRKKLREASST